MRLLIGSAFNFVIDPTELHMIAEFIQKEEAKIHTNNKREWKTCVRMKAGNDGATREFLDSLQPPGFLKICKFHLKKFLIWATGLPRQRTSTRWNRFWVKTKAVFIVGILPLLKATFYILDYVKDFCLFLFLFHRMDFIDDECSLLQGLIIFHGATILTSGIIMGLSIQMSNDIIQLDEIQSSCCVAFLRVLFFFCTPLMPIAIILRAVRISVKKEKIVADWGTNTESQSISRTWRQYNRLTTAKNKVMVAYSDLKIIEASTEAVFQMFTLLVFIIASILYPTRSGLGLLKNDSLYEYAFLVLSLLSSYASIMLSILTSMKIRKKGHLLFRSKILLGISFSLQLISRLLLMVPTAILALPSVTDIDIHQSEHTSVTADFFDIRKKRSEGSEDELGRIASCPGYLDVGPALNVLTSGLLLCIPILLHWVTLAIVYQSTEPVFRLLSKRERFLHILSNTWVTVPVRVPRHQVQIHKGHEQMKTIVLVTANLLLTATISAALIKPRSPWFPSLSQQLGLTWEAESSCHQVVGGSEFLLFFGLPSLLSHLTGCALLLLYYKIDHPWRELGQVSMRRFRFTVAR